ncbi:Glutamyl-tRNA reductase [Desulfamplus magnetovallimortis]|uniref:Glutamyl-tRNA reductase n=1 Tax=Desulfamplus magnetovallimortis TaxID=1246637 RepID=A0A1W1HIE2_9BACT|nr:glutamyl-tRNA reductase [Desulfamplus magnetovallimortis]SLM32210.1 Glutamyl-tRNA reductase [Desulfamplus magnetovallimortis]
MSNIILIGINHNTASVELREALAFTREEIIATLQTLKQNNRVKEALIFSTCNRMEILFIPEQSCNPECSCNMDSDRDARSITDTDSMISFLGETKKISPEKFRSSLYIYSNSEAVKHIFRVASSLDSMIVGEPQILGQVKSAYRDTVEANASGVIINRLMHKAFSIAKKIRRETGIGDNAVSISYAAVELASKIFSDLSQRSVMLLGAGEMAEIAIEHLISHGVESIIVANRTFKNGVAVAEKFNGKAITFDERLDALKDVDIIVSSTGATDYVLTKAHLKKAMQLRKHRPLFLIDIAVPRDIDPGINKIDNVYLYDIDDLQNIVDDNMDERKKEAVKGERLVEEAVIKFQKWIDSLDVVPTIVDIKNKIDTIAKSEAEKTLASLDLNDWQKEAIERMLQAVSSKIMHDPIRFLKNTGCHRDDSFYINAARQLFNLDNGLALPDTTKTEI